MACCLGFWFVPLFCGETATLLRKLGLCFLSRQAYFSQFRSGLWLWLSGLAFQPFPGLSRNPGRRNSAIVWPLGILCRPAPTFKPVGSGWGLWGQKPNGCLLFFLPPSYPLLPRRLDAPSSWGQGTCLTFWDSSQPCPERGLKTWLPWVLPALGFVFILGRFYFSNYQKDSFCKCDIVAPSFKEISWEKWESKMNLNFSPFFCSQAFSPSPSYFLK